jgi:hypothetical protein
MCATWHPRSFSWRFHGSTTSFAQCGGVPFSASTRPGSCRACTSTWVTRIFFRIGVVALPSECLHQYLFRDPHQCLVRVYLHRQCYQDLLWLRLIQEAILLLLLLLGLDFRMEFASLRSSSMVQSAMLTEPPLVNLIVCRKLPLFHIGRPLWQRNIVHWSRTRLGPWFLLCLAETWMIVNEFIRLSTKPTSLLIDIRQGWLQRASSKDWGLTTMTLLALLSNQQLFDWCYLLLFHEDGSFTSWMFRMCFFMIF